MQRFGPVRFDGQRDCQRGVPVAHAIYRGGPGWSVRSPSRAWPPPTARYSHGGHVAHTRTDTDPDAQRTPTPTPGPTPTPTRAYTHAHAHADADAHAHADADADADPTPCAVPVAQLHVQPTEQEQARQLREHLDADRTVGLSITAWSWSFGDGSTTGTGATTTPRLPLAQNTTYQVTAHRDQSGRRSRSPDPSRQRPTMKPNSRGRSAPQPAGQALVEFSLAIIVFLVLLMGVVDFGMAIYKYNGVSQAAREIARVASVRPGPVSFGVSDQINAVVATQQKFVPGLTSGRSPAPTSMARRSRSSGASATRKPDGRAALRQRHCPGAVSGDHAPGGRVRDVHDERFEQCPAPAIARRP